VKDLPRSATIHRALSRDPKIKLGSLVAPTRERMQSEGETLDLLLATHFPNSVGMERGTLSPAVGHTKRSDWRVAVKIVTYRRVEWAIDSFAPF